MDPRLTIWQDPPAMDAGVPSPTLRCTKAGIYCAYYLSKAESDKGRVALLRFDGALQIRFGYPNDEALSGHPLWKYGLRHYNFYEVENSQLIAEIEDQNRIHRSHRPGIYSNFRHWIATFHDETLEIAARNATVIGISPLSANQALDLI